MSASIFVNRRLARAAFIVSTQRIAGRRGPLRSRLAGIMRQRRRKLALFAVLLLFFTLLPLSASDRADDEDWEERRPDDDEDDEDDEDGEDHDGDTGDEDHEQAWSEQGGIDDGDGIIRTTDAGFIEAGSKMGNKNVDGIDWKLFRKLNGLYGDHEHGSHFIRLDRNGDGKVSLKELGAVGVQLQQWLDYYDKDGDGALDYEEFIPWFRERELWLLALSRGKLGGPDPPGHLNHLGSHRPNYEPELMDVLEVGAIRPSKFWTDYIAAHRPALLRGVEKDSVGAKSWTAERLKREFGDVALKIEPAKEARGNSKAYGDVDKYEHRMNISQFLDVVSETPSSNIYAVSIIPQKMAWEVSVPPALLCGSRRTQKRKDGRRHVHPFPHPSGREWVTHIYEANLWLGVGNTRSQLHYDKEDVMNCLYSGEKEWIIFDTRKYHKNFLWARGGRYNTKSDLLNAGTDWVPINTQAVDLRVHSLLQDTPFYRVTQKAGDCIYVPYSMLHFVNKTDPGLQSAVSYMWLPQEHFDSEACEKVPLADEGKARVPLAAFDILWYYSGRGIIPQGYPDPEYEVAHPISKMMRERRTEYLTKDLLRAWVRQGNSDLLEKGEDFDEMWELFAAHAKRNPGKGLHVSEMKWTSRGGVSLDTWLKLAAEGDPEGGLPCDHGQRYFARPKSEYTRMDEALRTVEKGKQPSYIVSGETRDEL